MKGMAANLTTGSTHNLQCLVSSSQPLVAWKCTYRGEADYEVIRGDLAGTRLSVRFLTPSWYIADFHENWGGVWTKDWETYQREVMATVGIVRGAGQPQGLPEEIVAAVNADFEKYRPSNPEIFGGPFKNGIFDPKAGWTAH
ncbi:hypothetical protein [Ralstonia pseudosolanacearum]|uniref:hypothetical protein n=1 Tax=Ralstonia pseudosolanacearum TaxID=1310165 RepID=UPI003CE999DA